MGESKEILELLQKIQEDTAERKRYAKKQFYMSVIMAVSSSAVLALGAAAYLSVIPRLRSTLHEAENVVKELSDVSGQLSRIDFEGLAEHMEDLAATSERGVSEALEKLESVDIDSLNSAIRGLSDVVSPFSRFMSRFN